MTSKQYKPLLKAALEKTKKEQPEPSEPQRWRRSEYGYASPSGPTFYAEMGEWFEIVSNSVIKADDRIAGKNLHGSATIRRAFADAGLDPRNPSHWYDLLQIFTDAHYLRRPIPKRLTLSKLEAIREHAECIREIEPSISKANLIRAMKDPSKKFSKCPSNKYPSGSTLAKLLHKAGVRWYTQPTKKRPLKKSK